MVSTYAIIQPDMFFFWPFENLRDFVATLTSKFTKCVKKERIRLIKNQRRNKNDFTVQIEFAFSLQCVCGTVNSQILRLFRFSALNIGFNQNCSQKLLVDLVWSLLSVFRSFSSINFNQDASLICVSSDHGTVHVFAAEDPKRNKQSRFVA